MAKTDLEQLVVQLSADIKGYENALAKAQQVTVTQLRNMERTTDKSLSNIEKRFSEFGLTLKDAILPSAAAVAIGLGELIKNAVKDAAQIGNLSDKLGLATDKLQGLAYGAVQSDTNFEELSAGLLKFSKNIGEAANGSGSLVQILRQNNVAITDSTGKQRSYNDLLNDFADLVQNAKNQQEALALVTAAFGKGSDGFLKFFEHGSDGLKTFEKDATNAGAVIKEELIKRAQELDDKWAATMQSLKSNTQSAVLFIVDQISKLGAASTDKNLGRLFTGFKLTSTQQNAPRISGGGNGGDFGGPNEFAAFPATTSARGPTILPDPEVLQRGLDTLAALKKEQADAARVAADHAKAIAKVIAALTTEEGAVAASNVQQRIANELLRAGTTADTEKGKTIVALVQSIEIQKQKLEDANYATEQLVDKQKAFYEGLSYLAESGVSAFDDLIVQGKSLDDVLKNVLSSLVSATIQAAALGQGPLAGLFGTQSNSGGLGGFFGNLLSSFNPSTPASIYHSGGTAGMGGLSRNVHPGVFSGAPRYHSGGIAGLMPGEVPAILQRGEIITPRGARTSGGTNVQIIDQRTNAPAVEKTQDSNGNLRFLIRDEMRRSVSSGDQDGAFGGRFGARPVRNKRG